MTIDYQPPTLREVLDRGEPLGRYVSLHMFEDDIAEIRRNHPDEVIESARDRQSWKNDPGFVDFVGGADRAREAVTKWAWTVELASNPDLMPRVLAVLPAEMVANLERRLREDLHFLSLTVRTRDDGEHIWNCESCGAHLLGERLVIVAEEHGRDLIQHPLHFCRSCVAMAMSAFTQEHSLN